ncbi:zinc finger protein ZFPM1-like [Littorina saxatilis]|uniref:zinc finger protein ZFPM1-like n=1 Tax=Littorina saxatilis TaxID=31220 RepID=UPI0038B614AB
MSRRKQSNPKSIKVSADSAESEDTEKDADIKEELCDPGEGTEPHDQEMRTDTPRSGTPHESQDSPDHIDVVNNFHSPSHNSSSPRPSSKTPPTPGGQFQDDRVVVKVEKDDDDDDESGHHGNDLVENRSQRNDLGSPGNSKTEDPATMGLVRHLQLPSDVLYLKEVEVNMHGKTTSSWMICSGIPLPKGSSLGPFAGDLVSSDNVRVGDLIVEFHSKTGHVALVNVAGLSGGWLALLRPAVNGVTRNTLVYLEGGRIWCEIVSDVDIGTELRANFVFDLEDLSLADREMSMAPVSPLPTAPERPPSSVTPPLQQSASAVQQPSPPGHAALIYGCPFCGVRFSSPRTLQGHLSYYCSKKRSEHIVSPRPKSRRSSDNSSQGSLQTEMVRVKQEESMESPHISQVSPSKAASSVGKKRPAAATDTNGSGRSSASPPPAKSACLDTQVFQCPLCSYRADKPASLNRHMRIHNRPLEETGGSATSARAGSSPAGSSVPSSATYCQECNIQFSSMGTFRCHKEHYCSMRQVGRPSAELKQPEAPPFAMSAHHAASLGIPADLSTATPLQLAALSQSGMFFPPGQAMASEAGGLTPGGAVMPGGQAAMILTAPVMTPSGITSMAIPLPTVLVQSIHNAAAAAAAHAASVGPPASPRTAMSPKKSASPPEASESSPRRTPEEAHQRKSPKALSPETEAGESVKELPLDLSKKKSDSEQASTAEVHSIKREKSETSSSSSVRSASHSSPLATRSSSVGSDRRASSPSPSRTPAAPTSMSAIPPPLLNPSLLQSFLPFQTMAAAAAAGMTGLPVAPQGHAFGAVPPAVSKCTDCNIIFYKHENFLIHKQHYCSGVKLKASSTAPAAARRAEPDVIKVETSSTLTSAPEQGTSRSPLSSPPVSKDHESASGSHPQLTSPVSNSKIPALTPTVASGGQEDIYYKFLCVPCKIKFSSASNLKAHKEYYCPHGKNSDHTIIAQTPNGEIVGTANHDQGSPSSEGSSPSPSQHYCTQCKAVFSSSRLLKIHLCNAEETQTCLLRCSHCDYITYTDKRLAEHMKVHNPTSAYRCTLCGYRGNTVRGMRMHGKTHTDNGEDFTDEHMIEFQEPPLVPIQTNGDHKGHGPVDMEVELLRLKNEPYKRRRSRKAYEKVDILVPLEDYPCQLCGELFPDQRSLAIHFRIHEIASQYMQELARCGLCDYVTKSVEDLRAHMEISHSVIPREEKENHPQSNSPDRARSVDRRSSERASSSEKRSPVRIKEEPIDRDYEQRSETSSVPVRDHYKRNDSSPEETLTTVKVEKKNRDITRQRSANCSPHEEERNSAENTSDKVDVVRVKTEPGLEGDDDSCNDPPLPITFATPPSTSQPLRSRSPPSPAHRSSSSSHASAGQGHSSPPSSRSSPIIKQEPVFAAQSLAISAASLFPRFIGPPLTPAAEIGSGPHPSQERNAVKAREGLYCQNCDISFTYRSTFVAHKEHYCNKRAGVPTSATA